MQDSPIIIDSQFVVAQKPVDSVESAGDAVLDAAQENAATIVAEAQKVAEGYLTEATQQAPKIKQQAYDEGYQKGQSEGYQQGQDEGYQQGYEQGKHEGLTEMQQVIHDAVAKTTHMLATTEQEVKDMIVLAEEQIVEIALAVARKILAYEISENPMVVLPLVKSALQKVSDQEDVVIRASVDDFEAVLMAKKDLQIMVGSEHALKIIVDHTITSGSCMIDTSYGTVDASIDTQFETIKKALQGVA